MSAWVRRSVTRLRRRLARLPRLLYVVCAVALLNGTAWSVITPPFQVADEISHIGYAQYLAETGKLPVFRANQPQYSGEERALLTAEQFFGVIGPPQNKPPWYQRQIQAVLRQQQGAADRRGVGSVSSATDNPPLYYLLEAVPYWVSPSHALLDRLVLMRLLSVLMSVLAVGLVFLFLREVLPGAPWSWPVGALLVALNPTFGQISGGVNADNLLFLVSAATFLLIARSFRRGLTLRRGVLLGVASAAGLLAKPAFIGLIPGIVLALLILVVRRRGVSGLKAGAWALAAALVPLMLYALALKTVWTRPLAPGQLSLTGPASPELHNLKEQVSFVWQLFLPRLPFMADKGVGLGGAAPYPGQFPLRDVWEVGLVGKFGWLDYGFAPAVYDAAWSILQAVGVLFCFGLVTVRRTLRRRLCEILAYAALAVGLMAVIGFADYRAQILVQPRFEQTRYLMPLLALYGGFFAVAVRGLGHRVGPLLGAALIMLAAAHTVFAQMLTVARFYA
ncbi:MAG TPA: DUF2142 domain-containing protein [Solirubrobacteraceae bacterium]|jgi:4-amino-4-deoxy-L-arabinose transferase-like glycosyltransferase|nr:DUF2142 domain-containing protein [Solirubrobacteraceae bacterium]